MRGRTLGSTEHAQQPAPKILLALVGASRHAIADEVELAGTVLALAPTLHDFAETQLETTARKIAQAFGSDIAQPLAEGVR
ncbi:hypothetical protein X760_18290 [Mesorhizobium sp. LSHC422A00]|nr:hypothetical protein X762_31525 [Mesorhizobium sp. LSHC426A00]ESX43410.1 hypothetical protein X761_33100 [Mesorhizobium sp. LSHC424B00]ESX60167.1 hypothetical protein X760_18290 [Mesorhizobium sp. LSHC422A00]ESX63962.1 hypothetical protein X758_32625 [Mesorhizobium sp. LSHC416B00]